MKIEKLKPAITSFVAAMLAVALVLPGAAHSDGEVNVYSARKEALILPLLERFSDETGIKFNLVTGKADELLKRIQVEGDATPADVFITVDAGRLHRAKVAGVLRTLDTDDFREVISAVPANLRDVDGYWVALSQRARTIIYAVGRISPEQLSTYENLASDRFKGKICIRSSSNIYNQSMVASMIEANGRKATVSWAAGLVGNFARPPAGGDTDQIKAVAAGECDMAVANTYYFGRLAGSDDKAKRDIVKNLRIFWPNQSNTDNPRGVHVNVSGVGITSHAKNPENAKTLIGYLLRKESQQWYASVNHEFPVIPEVPVSEVIIAMGWPGVKADSLNLSKLGEQNRAAVEVMDEAGWQ